MAYKDHNSDDFFKDIYVRKELYSVRKNNKRGKKDLEDVIKGKYLQLRGHQRFARNYFNPHNNKTSRLCIMQQTGAGKTKEVLAIGQDYAKVYMEIYRKELLKLGVSRKSQISADASSPSIFIIGFTKNIFIDELIKTPEFGFISIDEFEEFEKLKLSASRGVQADIKRADDFRSRIKRRLTNKYYGGFYKFYGYQEFANKLFTSDKIDLRKLEKLAERGGLDIGGKKITLERAIFEYVKRGEILVNMDLLNRFRNSLVICDEAHHLYNSIEKNSYGIAIQYVLDYTKSASALFVTYTVIYHSPAEIIDMLNLLGVSENKLVKSDYFIGRSKIKPGAAEKIGELSRGHFVFLQEKDPKYFPRTNYIGESHKLPPNSCEFTEIPYLKFITTTMSDAQMDAYIGFIRSSEQENKDKQESIVVPADGMTISDMVFPDPLSNGYIFRSRAIREKFAAATQKDLNKAGISFEVRKNGSLNIYGRFLKLENLSKISPKYSEMVKRIHAIFEDTPSKMFIFHSRVKMSGVTLIENIVREMGFISEFESPRGETICTICGKIRNSHGEQHEYLPARYIMAHSEIEKKQMDGAISRFNNISNASGKNIKLLIGSKIIRESYDIKCVRHFFIMSPPTSIQELIQIIGRCVRTGSHTDIEESLRNVNISIFISKLNIDRMKTEKLTINFKSPDEQRYVDKIREYLQIQQLSKQITKNAIDANHMRDVIMSKYFLQEYFPHDEITEDNAQDFMYAPEDKSVDTFGNLYYLPVDIQRGEKSESELNTITFNAYGGLKDELKNILFIIKQLFVQASTWKYDDLWELVKDPPFLIEYNTSTFSEGNFAVVLSSLSTHSRADVRDIYSHRGNYLKYREEKSDSDLDIRKVLFSMFNPNDKSIIVDGTPYRIYRVGEYYIRFPENDDYSGGSKYEAVNFDINMFDIKPLGGASEYTSIDEFSNELRMGKNYSAAKSRFISKYAPKLREASDNSDEILEIMMNFLSDFNDEFHSQIIKDSINYVISGEEDENDIIYESVLTLFDNFDRIIYVEQVAKYKNVVMLINGKNIIDYPRGVSSIRRKDIKIKVEEYTPVGFVGKNSIMVYDEPEWIRVPKSEMNVRTYFEEKGDIIAYYEISQDNTVKFKIRPPIGDESDKSDQRKVKSGIVCKTQSKGNLIRIAKSLGIDDIQHDPKHRRKRIMKIDRLCQKIELKLLQMEIEERVNRSKYKYVYMLYENAPTKPKKK